MPCMCGDICCSSCGPAQGNWRCPICRVWKSEGCEHITTRSLQRVVSCTLEDSYGQFVWQEKLACGHVINHACRPPKVTKRNCGQCAGQLKRQYRKQVEEQAKAEAEAEAKQIQEEEDLIFKALDDGEDPSMFSHWIVKKWREKRA